VYAGGRPLWHLSLAAQPLAPVSRWDRHTRRRIDAIRDSIMSRIGTNEQLIEEVGSTAMHWRKPLAITEVNQLAPTAEVLQRPGRA